MSPFSGFNTSTGKNTPIPAAFFTELLPQITDLDELRVILWAFRSLDQQQGDLRYLTHEDFMEAEDFILCLGKTEKEQKERLLKALEGSVRLGALLKAENGDQVLFFLNSARGRAAIEALSQGAWQPGANHSMGFTAARPNIFALYEQNIGLITPLISDELRDAEDQYPVDWINDAFRIAVSNNARSWRYIEVILRKWGKKKAVMKEINDPLRKIANSTVRANMATSSSTKTAKTTEEVCPICGGVGFVRKDVPISDPDFGKLTLCVCKQNEQNRTAQERLLRMSNLEAFGQMTFHSFSVQGRLGLGDEQIQSLQYGLSQAQQYAATPRGWMVLMGTYGCGKTHLAAAIANTCVEYGMNTLFLTVPDLLDWLRYSYDASDTTFEQRFEEIRNVGLLVLDDLGSQNSTKWAAEKLFQIIDYRYSRKLPLVVTTNLTFEDLDDRIRSRLQDPDLSTRVRISAPDYRAPIKDSKDPLVYQLQLLGDRSFGNWSGREPKRLPQEVQTNLETVFRAAQDFAESPRGWLVMMGTYGCGKTHLAAAIGNYRKGMGDDPIFVVVPDLLDHLRATFSPASNVSYDEMFNRVKSASVLILDDLGTQSATPWAREKLYQIFNERYNAKLPTVITMSGNLDDLDARIRSRMLDGRLCSIYEIMAPSYRGGMPRTERPRKSR